MNNPIFVCVDRNPFGSIEKLISLVAGVGFGGIEWLETGARETWTEPETARVIRAEMRKRELACQYHAPYEDSFDLAQDEGQLRTPESVALVLAHMLDRAECLDARLVNTHLGTCPEETDRAEAMRVVMEGVRLVLPELEKRRIRLALENHTGAYFKGPLGDRPEDFDWLFANLDSEWVGQNIDIGHANINGQVDAFLGRPLDRLIDMHLHDNAGEADDHLPLGKGGIMWDAILPRLAASCYHGPLVLEFFAEAEDYVRAMDMIREHN